MLGDLIYEHKGKTTGQRVLDVSPPRVETSFSATGTLKVGITVSEMGTYWSEARSPGILYGEGQGIIMTNDGTEDSNLERKWDRPNERRRKGQFPWSNILEYSIYR